MYQKFRKFFITLCSILSIGALNNEVSADDQPQNLADKKIEHYNLKNQLAIKGYDPVAYFVQGKAIKGNPQFTYKHNTVNYQFQNPENLNKFKISPSKYEPQYGGWCAYAFAIGGGKVSINPKRFKIIDGKLYLFYDTLLGPNTLKKWDKGNDSELIEKADQRWLEVSK